MISYLCFSCTESSQELPQRDSDVHIVIRKLILEVWLVTVHERSHGNPLVIVFICFDPAAAPVRMTQDAVVRPTGETRRSCYFYAETIFDSGGVCLQHPGSTLSVCRVEQPWRWSLWYEPGVHDRQRRVLNAQGIFVLSAPLPRLTEHVGCSRLDTLGCF